MESTLIKNPFFSILIWPTETFNHLIKKNIRNITLLFILGSIYQVIQKFWNVSPATNIASGLIVNCLIGVAIGWVSFYILSAVIAYTGRLLGGKGTTKASVLIVAWSFIPCIISVVIYFTALAIFGQIILTNAPASDSIGAARAFISVSNLVLGLWSLFILLNGIKLIHGFSFTKAALTMLIILAGAFILWLPLLIL